MFELKKIDSLPLDTKRLKIDDVVSVSKFHRSVRLTDDAVVQDKIEASRRYISDAVNKGKPIYGVTSGFGGMADVVITPEEAYALQANLVQYHKVGAGKPLPKKDVRAAMLIRAKSHLRGASGIRYELIKRLEIFLNEDVIPIVPDLGSIGASGDLTPLAYITGCITGLSDSFQVEMRGKKIPATEALQTLNLETLVLEPKEGLAMMNGTSVMTGIAANLIHDTDAILKLTLGAHALFAQGLHATNQSFHPFIHQCKPHLGQKWVASEMIRLLKDSGLIRHELDGSHDYRGSEPIQDRYSLRCLPQFLSPILEGIQSIKKQIEVELNSTTDNPLIDAENQVSYHGGNFLGQHIGVAMDQLRYYNALLSKHLDAQISLLVAPEFNNGLSASLKGNGNKSINMGMKGLQITSNSIMPLIGFYGNSIADRFPTHAEQFNQNINSQGFGSANLTRESNYLMQQYLSTALLFGIQAVDLRTKSLFGHYDASRYLSGPTRALYLSIKKLLGTQPSEERPFLWDDSDRSLDLDIEHLFTAIKENGPVTESINGHL
ncbi:HAL/PAL/TAL family ammonia-lyase [Flagellimonas allohymeniacidonis]|uniref:Aromatic amino acid lyase n=1 Tax=Flagellimonas allohymeniacidonis TaxID=2517819 RepID=A0A4Q8QI94_9FLAO|nr:aromatic amino acid ammonia-lyase [Allomuricauda hymeniacidonis]TAI49567.1 aromatic amino acid lyase [Allomuricauda hymeniacidonis]